jgi:transposase
LSRNKRLPRASSIPTRRIQTDCPIEKPTPKTGTKKNEPTHRPIDNRATPREKGGLAALRQEARRELPNESRKHFAVKLLRQIPAIGPIRAARLVALIQTPHRFRTKRQFWSYIGLALKTYGSGEYRFVGGQLQRSKKSLAIRGLNLNHNHDLKNIFKGAATWAAANSGPFQNFYQACLARGMKPSMARLTLARKIAAITLLVWKKGVRFDAEYLKQQAA